MLLLCCPAAVLSQLAMWDELWWDDGLYHSQPVLDGTLEPQLQSPVSPSPFFLPLQWQLNRCQGLQPNTNVSSSSSAGTAPGMQYMVLAVNQHTPPGHTIWPKRLLCLANAAHPCEQQWCMCGWLFVASSGGGGCASMMPSNVSLQQYLNLPQSCVGTPGGLCNLCHSSQQREHFLTAHLCLRH
jgi:hypothetical protein